MQPAATRIRRRRPGLPPPSVPGAAVWLLIPHRARSAERDPVALTRVASLSAPLRVAERARHRRTGASVIRGANTPRNHLPARQTPSTLRKARSVAAHRSPVPGAAVPDVPRCSARNPVGPPGPGWTRSSGPCRTARSATDRARSVRLDGRLARQSAVAGIRHNSPPTGPPHMTPRIVIHPRRSGRRRWSANASWTCRTRSARSSWARRSRTARREPARGHPQHAAGRGRAGERPAVRIELLQATGSSNSTRRGCDGRETDRRHRVRDGFPTRRRRPRSGTLRGIGQLKSTCTTSGSAQPSIPDPCPRLLTGPSRTCVRRSGHGDDHTLPL